MATPAQPLNDLVTKIRATYPGAYDDMDDATLTKQVLAKYPQYSDLAAPKIQPPQPVMQQSNLAIATGGEDGGVANPQQPAEQFAIQNPEQQGKLAGAAAVGAGGAAGIEMLPTILPHIAAAAQHPVVKEILTAGAKKLAEVAGGYSAYEIIHQFLKAKSK